MDGRNRREWIQREWIHRKGQNFIPCTFQVKWSCLNTPVLTSKHETIYRHLEWKVLVEFGMEGIRTTSEHHLTSVRRA